MPELPLLPISGDTDGLCVRSTIGERTIYLVPCGAGAFTEVFDLRGGRVLKAFYDVELEVGGGDATLSPKVAWAAERVASERLQQHPDLAAFVPRYFGVADPKDYPLKSARTYEARCGLILEKIPGSDVKIAELPNDILVEADRVLESIRKRVGVDDPWDASCFVPGIRVPFTLIDFATPTRRLVDLDRILKRHGHLPQQSRRLLGLE